MSDESKEAKQLIDAEERLRTFILARIPSSHSIIMFMANVAREATTELDSLAVASTKQGAVLLYNPEFVLSLDDNELMFAITHEFIHLATDSFARSEDFMKMYGFSKHTFLTKVAPYFDIIVNDMILNMPGFKSLNERLELIHSNASDIPAILRGVKTLDGMVKIIADHLDDIPEVKSKDLEYTFSRSDASEDDNDSIRELLKRVVTNGIAGGIPGNITNALSSNLLADTASQRKSSKALWERIVRDIRMTRASVIQRKRSMRRINRRTLLPPGRVSDKGFHVLFLLDESGSVADPFIRYAFNMVEHAALGDRSDTIHVAHWDTSLVKLEKVKKGAKPELKREACGGTSFSTIYTHQEIKNMMVDMCIVVTDGETYEWPKGRPPYPTVWLINTQGGYSIWKSNCGTGTALYVPEESML